jgi:hypothetical protein
MKGTAATVPQSRDQIRMGSEVQPIEAFRRLAVANAPGGQVTLASLTEETDLGPNDEVVRILQVAENRGIARIREVDVHLVHLFNARLGECLRLFFEPSRRRYATFWYPLAVFLIFFALAHCARLIADALPATLRT